MRQRPGDRTSRSIRAQRTQPAIPGATVPTAPLIVPAQQYNNGAQAPVKKHIHHARRAALKLVSLGVLLELCFLAFYPLLANASIKNTVARQAWLNLFPWLPHFYWTTRFPVVVQVLNHIPLFDMGSGSVSTPGNANLLLLLFGLAFAFLWFPIRIAGRVVREQLSRRDVELIYWTILLLTGLFGVTFLFAPGFISQDVFLYGIFGRMVTVYHINPYVINLARFSSDLLGHVLYKGTSGTAPYGPIWIDLSIPVTLIARESIANIVLGFRLIGLLAHLVDTILIWAILAKLKPEMRISGTLLFAWNPVVLLLGVSEMHFDGVVILFILLGVLFFQRGSLLLGWIFVLLASLVNFFCLLLLPLFFRLLRREVRTMQRGRRFLWWLATFFISVLIVILAYAPYWQGGGIASIGRTFEHTFFQENALHSLDAALLHLPIQLPYVLYWILVPGHWSIVAAITLGLLLLFGFWLGDTLELVLLFSSWLFLALAVLFPIYWPQYTLFPFALAILAGNRRTLLLALLLLMGAALSYYFLLWPQGWSGQGLVTLGVPLLVWGWTLFLTSTWQMTHSERSEQPEQGNMRAKGFSRPPWASRPSWPSRWR